MAENVVDRAHGVQALPAREDGAEQDHEEFTSGAKIRTAAHVLQDSMHAELDIVSALGQGCLKKREKVSDLAAGNEGRIGM